MISYSLLKSSMSKEIPLYSLSKKLARPWDGNKLGLLQTTSDSLYSNFFENKNMAVLVSFDYALEAQHIFLPSIYDRILPTDEVDPGSMVVGNAVDDLDQLVPMKTPKSILHHVPSILKKESVHPCFMDLIPLPKLHLKNTKWEKDDTPHFLVMVPIAMPLPFGVTVPYGNLADPEFQRQCRALGSEYEYQALALLQATRDHNDINKVIEAIIAKKQENLYMKQTDLSYEPHPFVQLSLLRDASECPGALDDLKKVFGIKKAQQLPVPPANHTAMGTQTFILAKPEDEEKKRAEEMSLHKLSIFFASDSNTSFERGAKNFDDGLQEPSWTPGFNEILGMKGDANKAISLVNLIEDAFNSAINVGVDIYRENSAITNACSMIYFPRNAASQLLKGNFCAESITSDMRERHDLTLGTFLYQENTDNKVILLKRQEIRAQTELDYDVPDNQRSQVESTIAIPGSLLTYEHAVGLIANSIKSFGCIAEKAFKAGDPMPVVISCYMALFGACSSPDKKRWVKDHAKDSPHFPLWLFNICQAIYVCAAKATKVPGNMTACRKGQFSQIDRTYHKQMVQITINALER